MNGGKRMLQTKLCEMFGIKYPIILAGMRYVSHPRLVAAVSNAGGLGTLRPQDDAKSMREEIREVKSFTDKPFGVDMLFATVAQSAKLEYTENIKRQIAVVCQERPACLVSALGDPAGAVAELHAHGIKVMALVGNVRQALRVEAAGVDMVVAQGHEAGGHVGRIAGMVVIPAVVDALKIPVVAAGSIVDPRQMLAALLLGACGVMMGTRFVATHEAYTHVNYKNKIVETDEEGPIISRVYSGKTARVIKNKVTQEWSKREAEILLFPLQEQQLDKFYYPGVYLAARKVDGPGDTDYGSCPAGQGAGMIKSIKSVQEVIDGMMEGVRKIVEHIQRTPLRV